jgi:hypothetical protein
MHMVKKPGCGVFRHGVCSTFVDLGLTCHPLR